MFGQKSLLATAVFLFFSVPLRQDAAAETAVILILDPGHGGKDRGGWDGKGFKLDGARISEDAYTYDVTKRIERLAVKKRWKTALTAVDEENGGISDNKDGEILPPRKKLVYNSGKRKTVVFAGKEGLLKRLEAVNKIAAGNKSAEKIFISLHFDHANRFLHGAQIFTAEKMARHPFVKILAEEFRENGLGLKFGPIPRLMINQRNELIVLTEGAITPRVLVELGNFQNERDRGLMLSGEGREKYAEIIVAAVEKYLERERQKTKD